MRSRLLVVRVIALTILLAAGSRVWAAPAAPPLRTVGFLVLPGVYNSELMAPCRPYPHHHRSFLPQEASTPAPGTIAPGAKGVSGQGALRFRVALTAAQLPEEARKVVVSAHGGFAVDHRPAREEPYFALPGAGILRMSADLKQVSLVPTAQEMKGTNLHHPSRQRLADVQPPPRASTMEKGGRVARPRDPGARDPGPRHGADCPTA